MAVGCSVLVQTTQQPVLSSGLTAGDWLRAGLIVVVAVVAAVAVNRAVRKVLGRVIASGFASIITARVAGYVAFLVGMFYALNGLGARVGPLLGALGLGGLVVALALQKLVENFVSGLMLQTRRPFTVGDTVRLDDHTGTVVDIDSRTTVLEGLDGSSIRIPNGNVVAGTIVNLTRNPQRRSTVDVAISYDTDLREATALIIGAVKGSEGIVAHPAPYVLVSEFAASTVTFTVYFWHGSTVAEELAARHELMLNVHRVLAEAALPAALPQVVVRYDDPTGTG